MQTTPPLATKSLPPVTPSRHIATAAAKAKAIAPPGQPRKTPLAKRVAHDSTDDEDDHDEEMDVLPALGALPVARSRVKPKATASRGITASEQRPSRVTRSTAGAAAIRKTGTGAVPASPVKSSGQGPNKIPRLATTRTTSAAKAAAAAASNPPAANTRRMNPPPSPTHSRLPTLIPSKRPHHVSSLSEVSTVASFKRAGAGGADAWMTNNTSAVVVPATKSERPGLRSVRRRRSSFSSADVVA